MLTVAGNTSPTELVSHSRGQLVMPRSTHIKVSSRVAETTSRRSHMWWSISWEGCYLGRISWREIRKRSISLSRKRKLTRLLKKFVKGCRISLCSILIMSKDLGLMSSLIITLWGGISNCFTERKASQLIRHMTGLSSISQNHTTRVQSQRRRSKNESRLSQATTPSSPLMTRFENSNSTKQFERSITKN